MRQSGCLALQKIWAASPTPTFKISQEVGSCYCLCNTICVHGALQVPRGSGGAYNLDANTREIRAEGEKKWRQGNTVLTYFS